MFLKGQKTAAGTCPFKGLIAGEQILIKANSSLASPVDIIK